MKAKTASAIFYAFLLCLLFTSGLSSIKPLTVSALPSSYPFFEGFETWNSTTKNQWDWAHGLPDYIEDLPSAKTGFHGLNLNFSAYDSDPNETDIGLDFATYIEADALKNATITFSFKINQLRVQEDWHFELFIAENYYAGYVCVLGFEQNETTGLTYLWFGTEIPYAAGGSGNWSQLIPIAASSTWHDVRIDFFSGDETTGLLHLRVDDVLLYQWNNRTKYAEYSDDWGIDGYLQFGCGQSYDTASSSFNIDLDDINIDTYTVYEEPQELPIWLIMGLAGLAMLFIGGFWTVYQIQRHNDFKQFFNGVIIALVGFALLVGWFYT